MLPFLRSPRWAQGAQLLLWAALLLRAEVAQATDKPWTGATDTTWATNGNWTGNKPAAGDNAVFNSSFSNQPNVGANASAGGLWFATGVGSNVTISGTSTLTLGGNTINSIAGLGIL